MKVLDAVIGELSRMKLLSKLLSNDLLYFIVNDT